MARLVSIYFVALAFNAVLDQTAKEHWAFQPVSKPTLPDVEDRFWTQTGIDPFVLRKLEQSGLRPAPVATARTLIRRATFNLIGLPPTPEEAAAFTADQRADALERLIDRLLASPHYGERWGRYWLDVARYADNKGYVFFEQKNYPWAWTYRDWVIGALNDDLPFDRFVTQQIAADRLDLGENKSVLPAMGFLTVGAHFSNNTHDIIDDRIDVVTRGLMGITVTCARCHDHKYDPIPQKDYYSLYGIFRSSIEPMVPPLFRPADKTKQYEVFEKGLTERVTKLQHFVAEQRELIMTGARERVAEYLLAVHLKRNHPSTENFMLLTDKGALIPAIIQRWEVYLKDGARENDPLWTVWNAFSRLSDDRFSASADQLHQRLFGSETNTTDPVPINPIVRRRFEKQAPTSIDEVARLYGTIFKEINSQWNSSIAAARQAGIDRPLAFADENKEQVRLAMYAKDSPATIPRSFGWGFLDLLPDRPTQEEYKKLLKEVEQWSASAPGAPARAMVMVDAENLYDPVVFLRGNPNRRGQTVARQAPRIVTSNDGRPFQHGSGRLELAQAIVDPTNPLTARVFVNRVWQHHFGVGLVDTASDFGVRGGQPSHPGLLDWLADRFVQSGWSIKELHRLIMTSAVFRQSSRPEKDMAAIGSRSDPKNRLLWAFPRRRIDFEAMRDSLLAVSGDLDRSMGGPPTNILEDFQRRRTVYGFVDRMDLPGLMRAFDFPDPAASSPGRDQTMIAPQALFFLNHEFVSACAHRLALRPDIASRTNKPDRIQRIFQILFGRHPTSSEFALGHSFLDSLHEEAEPWRDLVHSLMMTNEFVFID